MLSGNIGEWSELYVFLKLLAEGKLNAADANLNSISGVYYPIIKILREESAKRREFIINGNIEVYDPNAGVLLYTISKTTFIAKSKELFDSLKTAKGRSFSFPMIESFLKEIDVNSLKALSKEKADIRIVVHDLTTGLQPMLGFSIKSMIGKDSTLFNAGAGTNFIFRIGNVGQGFDLQKFNTDTLNLAKQSSKLSKLTLRLNELERLGFDVKLHAIQSDNLKLNLEIIDSKLPELLGYLVYYKFKNGVSSLKELLLILKKNNPLQFNLSKGHPFYDVKLKAFLTEIALGMTAETVWTGMYDATGGIIIVKETGEIVCYHIYNRNEFQEYLLDNTKLEQPSTSEDDFNPGHAKAVKPKPYKYGWVYEDNGDLLIKLNLQIRFK